MSKYALFLVPNYPAAGSTTASPKTYLALGDFAASNVRAELDNERKRGDDLLQMAGWESGKPFFADDSRASQLTDGVLPDGMVHADGKTTIQHTGVTYRRHDGNANTVEDRQTQTNKLLSRGGWRDHTDGNRIVTVRGDRTDVVMGNYKRVVFGRVKPIPDAIKPSWWEVSGGHIFQGTSTGVASLQSIEWVKESKATDGNDGYWKVVENTEKADLFVRYSGRTEEHFNGPSITSKTGRDGAHPDKNPHIKEVSWIDTKTASTTADDITTKTTVHTFDSETRGGSPSVFNNVTHCLTKWDTTGWTGGLPPLQFATGLWTDLQFNFDFFVGSLGFEVGGFSMGTAGHAVNVVGGTMLDLSAVGVDFELYMGSKTTIRLGSSADTFTGTQFTLNFPGPLDIVLKARKEKLSELNGCLLGIETTLKATNMSGATRRTYLFRSKT